MKTLVNDGLRFVCQSEAELWRARTLLTKEPGTIAWLQEQCREGDVFYDIGANVGCYTLYAARMVGERGHVYAFEPHPANAAALLRNIAANHYQGRVTVSTTALGRQVGFRPAHGWLSLGALEAGTSGHTVTQIPLGRMLVSLTSIDELCLVGPHLLPPHLVKIDVDGNEREILAGMSCTLVRGTLRSLQVESAPDARTAIEATLQTAGYVKVRNHYTQLCQQQLDSGASPESVIENAIFAHA